MKVNQPGSIQKTEESPAASVNNESEVEGTNLTAEQD